jgi:hypothetical protein
MNSIAKERIQLPDQLRRKIAAVLFSYFLWGAFYLSARATYRPGDDHTLDTVLILSLSIIGSSLILKRQRNDKFWKVVVFCLFAGWFPIYSFVVVGTIRYGTGGYFVLGLIVIVVASIASALCSLPFVGLFFWHRGRQLAG